MILNLQMTGSIILEVKRETAKGESKPEPTKAKTKCK